MFKATWNHEIIKDGTHIPHLCWEDDYETLKEIKDELNIHNDVYFDGGDCGRSLNRWISELDCAFKDEKSFNYDTETESFNFRVTRIN